MSYDLYFYKKKGADTSEEKIREYLTNNINSTSESDTQWISENEDTETYFSFDLNEPETDEESIQLFESFKDFEYTRFTFNLNYLRPDFFGQNAFLFVDKFIKELDLYVLNPQSITNPDNPVKPKEGELYQNWSTINADNSATYFKEYGLEYLPLNKSNEIYDYNLNRTKIQAELGDNYFVPKLFFFKTKKDNRIVTLCTWTEHIPNVFPPADYYLLTKTYKKFFRTVKESGLISSASLYERFSELIESFHFKNCKIIHPDKAEQATKLFNTTKLEYTLEEFADRLPIEKLVNSKPTK